VRFTGPSAIGRGLAGAATLVVLLVSACASPPGGAPVVERRVVDEPTAARAGAPSGRSSAGGAAAGDWRPEVYTVQRGDTLYAIALDHGLDYREVAAWNALPNPNVIFAGQQLRLRPPAGWKAPEPEPDPGLTPQPSPKGSAVSGPPPSDALPGGATQEVAARSPTSATEQVVARPLTPSAPVQAEALEGPAPVKTGPKGIKVAYSDEALARMRGEPVAPAQASAPPAATKPAPGPKPTPPKTVAAAPQPAPTAAADKPVSQPAPAAKNASPPSEPASATGWIWPTQGTLLHGFSQGSNPKGVAIGGDLGQSIVASAAGKVVYSGSGLRGYGNLIIIKHSETYLSVYAHNRKLLVKEGERVSKGQKIAEMGNLDAQTVALHFEIRRYGKPVDPLEYLPGGGAS